mgnify:CR=1 FL=1
MQAIKVESLRKRYGDREVLKGINLEIEEGEFYALMGPNGSGKTTLVSIIASVIPPSEGRVEILGKDARLMKKYIGYVPQGNFSSPHLTGRENLTYFARLMGYPKDKVRKIVDELLERVGLSKEADKKVSKYSGGMRKRLEVATAFMPGIKVLILDEPTTGLDPSARKSFLGMLQEMKEEDTTILLVTHIGSDAEIASRVAFMDDGKIVADGKPEELKRKSGLRYVVNVETAIKSKRIRDAIEKFGEEGLLETESGYRVYCDDAEKASPEIVKILDRIGCKVTRIGIEKPSLEDVFFKLTKKGVGG